MKHFRTILTFALAALALGCSTGVDLPKGTSRGYTSARLMSKQPHLTIPAEYQSAQSRIRRSISTELARNGLQVTSGPADLIVGHLVVLQDSAMTTYLDEYYGSGVEAEAISDAAHQAGVIESKRREYFQQAGLVIDVVDARTNELVFRNYVRRDILPAGTPASTREQVVNQAVAETLAPFFR